VHAERYHEWDESGVRDGGVLGCEGMGSGDGAGHAELPEDAGVFLESSVGKIGEGKAVERNPRRTWPALLRVSLDSNH
jgi:hypothetical protein